MPIINLYRIEDGRTEDFEHIINEKYQPGGENNVVFNLINDGVITERTYRFRLFFDTHTPTKPLSWNWAFQCFNRNTLESSGGPKAVIIVSNNVHVYAISFSFSYYHIDPYCDKEFPFSFAKRLNFQGIKTTALTNPYSRKNRTVNTYINYRELDFESGESLAKLKGIVQLNDGFVLYKKNIEVGNSIKFSCDTANLNIITELIEHIENTIANLPEIIRIPLFVKIKDETEVNRLDTTFATDYEQNLTNVDFSEYQIYATNIIFNQGDGFELLYNGQSQTYDSMDFDKVLDFSERFNIDLHQNMFNINVAVIKENNQRFTKPLKELIYYTNEESQALLYGGIWYRYNADYLRYLRDSLSNIDTEYNNTENFSGHEHDIFINDKYEELRGHIDFIGLTREQGLQKIRQKYYKEYYFNEHLTQNGFTNFDRDLEVYHQHKLEVMDLYKDNTMFTVKIGNTSSKLAYAVDQSLIALKLYQRHLLEGLPNIKEICLWLILERRTELTIVDGGPDINELNMIILKSKIDEWKKEVLLAGKHPLIKINYVR